MLLLLLQLKKQEKGLVNTIAKKEKNGPAISHKEDSATLAAYFKEILPDYDDSKISLIINYRVVKLSEQSQVYFEWIIASCLASEVYKIKLKGF